MDLHEPEPRAPGRRPVDYRLNPRPRGLTVSDHSWLMEEWDWENNEVDPDTYTLGSQNSVWWKCRVCSESWFMQVRHRYNSGRNCPNGCIPLETAPISETHPEYASTLIGDPTAVFRDQHDEMEWDTGYGIVVLSPYYVCRYGFEKQRPLMLTDAPYWDRVDSIQDEGVDPMSLTVASHQSIWWRCSRGHRFRRKVATYHHQTDSCPKCNGRDGATFSQKYPHLVDEWSDTNTLRPEEVSASSWYSVDWVCKDCGYEWETGIANRTSHGSGCPNCYKRSGATSNIEQTIRSEIAELLEEDVSGQVTVDTHSSDRRYRAFLDMCTHDRIAVEYDSWYWHQNRYDRDSERVRDVVNEGYDVISIREIGLDPVGQHVITYDPGKDTLIEVARRTTELIRSIRISRSERT